ncbi:MAG: hypothetical protein IPF66_14215 [Holophagales bacterium]|nr:hypothetical protein [Holophagales bacterium]
MIATSPIIQAPPTTAETSAPTTPRQAICRPVIRRRTATVSAVKRGSHADRREALEEDQPRHAGGDREPEERPPAGGVDDQAGDRAAEDAGEAEERREERVLGRREPLLGDAQEKDAERPHAEAARDHLERHRAALTGPAPSR